MRNIAAIARASWASASARMGFSIALPAARLAAITLLQKKNKKPGLSDHHCFLVLPKNRTHRVGDFTDGGLCLNRVHNSRHQVLF